MDATRLSFFADLLNAQMRQRSWNAVRLAKELKISKQTAYRWIKPQSTLDLPGDETMDTVAKFLGLPVHQLLEAKLAIKAAAKGMSVDKGQETLLKAAEARLAALGLSADKERVCDLMDRNDYLGVIRLMCVMIEQRSNHA